MTNEDFEKMRDEMSRIFVINVHQGVEVAAIASIVWLYNTTMTEAADLARDWSVSIVQPDVLSREMAEVIASNIGPSIADALLHRRIPSAGNTGRSDSEVPTVSFGNSDNDTPTEQVDDGRPKGWTDALCLAYIGTEGEEDGEILAALFTYGDWNEIHKEFPLFVKWMNERSN